MIDLQQASERFEEFFGAGGDIRTYFAPGRVNLIGDHIDYSGGMVLPMALDRGTAVLVRARNDTAIRAVSLNRDASVHADITRTEFDESHDWFSYVLGVIHVLADDGHAVADGFDLLVGGDIPDGAGLSSSASLELAVAVMLNDLGGWGLSPTQLALAGQRAENEYIGVACGIMDQLAIARGQAGHALLMDCTTLDVTAVPFPADEVSLIIVNSNHRRSLADSAYNDRRAAVERAASVLGTDRLVDVPLADVLAAGGQLSDVELRRARHTVTEQARVVAAAEALRARDFARLGELMRESHESLRDDFEVTGPQLDALVEAAWAQPGVIGARMTGAGFGGCAVVLAEPGSEQQVIEGIADEYLATSGLTAIGMMMSSGDGARRIHDRQAGESA